MKLVPLKKQSKRSQRAYHAARRGSWNGVLPVTKVIPSKKGYDRNRARREERRAASDD